MNRIILIAIASLLFGCNNPNIKEEYYPNGQVMGKYTLDNNGMKQGIAYEYWENGKLQRESNFVDGKLNGLVTNYDSSGTKISVVNMVNDSLHGEAIAYYATGEIQAKGNHVHGKKNGIYTSFYKSGRTKLLAFMKNDSVINSIKFKDDNVSTIENVQMIPEDIIVPDTMSIGSKPTMKISFIDDVFVRYFSGVAEFEQKEKSRKFQSIANTTGADFVFHLPPDIKEGIYYLNLKIIPKNAADEVSTFGVLREVTIKKP